MWPWGSHTRKAASLEKLSLSEVPILTDDLDVETLFQAIDNSLIYLDKLSEQKSLLLGDRLCTVSELKETLTDFRRIIAGNGTAKAKERQLRERFDFYRSTGDDGKGRVLFTGYYEPYLTGSWKKTKRFCYPLYQFPANERFARCTRRQIDSEGALEGKDLEILWVDDAVDRFFLQIQGSGKIQMTDGSVIQLGYAQSNGQPYSSIGSYMIAKGILGNGSYSLQAIKEYLRTHRDEAEDIFNRNERYIFFRLLDKGPIGAMNVTVTDGRTIASDPDIYPLGALAFMQLRKPVIANGELIAWTPFSRFVLTQDVGSAIKGAGRIDIFCGSGSEAEEVAGRMKETGTLYFLLKKP